MPQAVITKHVIGCGRWRQQSGLRMTGNDRRVELQDLQDEFALLEDSQKRDDGYPPCADGVNAHQI
jgi:hypothetical protein